MQTVNAVLRSRRTLVLAGGLIVVACVAALLWWRVQYGAGSAPPRPDLTKLDRLPARPEDIEAHGGQASSVLEPNAARRANAEMPFAAGPIAIARPFIFAGSDEDRVQALRCLATAVLYEAGDDAEGEAAVAQVVLNRVRHAAFPATVCGVVYQGSQRAIGCQFTFTCDGSLRRQMSDAAWNRARDVAERALSGRIDEAVGLATHYHTDWVYPYWSPTLNKLARVGTHLFFGWPGSWGGPNAFRRQYRGGEAAIGAVAIAGSALPDATPSEDPTMPRLQGLPMAPARLPAGMGPVPLYGSRLRLSRADGRAFGLLAAPDATAAKLVNAALALCEKPGPCQVAAWANEDDIPGAYPIPAATRDTMVFEYVRDESAGKGALHFDCGRFPNKDPKRCL